MLRVLGVRWGFCSSRGGKKVQTVGFANSNIEDIKHLTYKVRGTVKFEKGKLLIYRSRWSFWRWLVDYLLYLAGLSYLGYHIYNRTNFELMPIIKHLYVGGVAVLLLLLARKFLKNHNVVREIYLLEGGKATQVVFQNQMKRRMFGEMLQSTYYNSIFAPKEAEPRMNELPRDLERVESGTLGSYWRKNFSNDDNFLLIPKQYEFMHTEIMNQVMKGKVIIV